jgi:hypothetical protein
MISACSSAHDRKRSESVPQDVAKYQPFGKSDMIEGWNSRSQVLGLGTCGKFFESRFLDDRKLNSMKSEDQFKTTQSG